MEDDKTGRIVMWRSFSQPRCDLQGKLKRSRPTHHDEDGPFFLFELML